MFSRLEGEDYLRGLDPDDFAHRLGERWGDLSAIHPFRDGNTRSQSAWVSMVALRAGHRIDWRRIDVDSLRDLRLHAVAGRPAPLGRYLRKHVLSD